MNKIREDTNVKIPKFREYNTFLNDKHKVMELKQIVKHYKLKCGQKKRKMELKNDIYEYLRNSYYAIKIQAMARGYFHRRLLSLRGPALFNRSLCVNETDFFLLENLTDIGNDEFISFRDDTDDKVYGCTIYSLNSFIINIKDPAHFINPYTRNQLNHSIIDTLISLTRICKALKIKYMSDEYFEQPKLTPQQKFNQRITNVFKTMDDLGNYTQIEWFYEMETNLKQIKFIRELYDIWNYRANLQQDVKNNISNFRDPFLNLNISTIANMSIERLNHMVLTIIERFVYSGINEESRVLGSYYVLCALTLVSSSAAEALPWLYNSVI